MLSPPLKTRGTASHGTWRSVRSSVVAPSQSEGNCIGAGNERKLQRSCHPFLKGATKTAYLFYSPSLNMSRGLLPPFTNRKGAPRGEKHAMRPSERSKRPLSCGSRRQRKSVVRSPSLTLLPSLSPDSHCSPVRNRRQVFREGRCANAICYMQLKVENWVEMLK